MVPDQLSLICQQMMSSSSLMNTLSSLRANPMPDSLRQDPPDIHQAIQARLIQTVIEEKIKNEILMATVLINSKIIDLQNQIVHEAQANSPPEPESHQMKQESAHSSEAEKDHHTTEDSEFKKPPHLRRIKNETKNIPKNYGKAIISFIERNEAVVRRVVAAAGDNNYAGFMATIRLKKRKVNSIADLRSLWLDEENPFAQATRILSSIFLKKHSLPYIFNSRVTNFQGHIKYRYRLIEALREPDQFTSIKMF